MTFAPLHALVGVMAADACRFFDGLHTLAVHYRRTRFRVAAYALALRAMEGRIEQVPDAFEAEAPEMVEHRLPGREIGREIAPRAAGAQDIEDSVEDTA
jgi:hypothetical protein